MEVGSKQDWTELESSDRRVGNGPSRSAKKGLEVLRSSWGGEGSNLGTVEE